MGTVMNGTDESIFIRGKDFSSESLCSALSYGSLSSP